MAFFFPRPYQPPIPRSDFEYPTENVSIAYLLIIDKLKVEEVNDSWPEAYTVDSFTDKAMKLRGRPHYNISPQGRYVDENNYYYIDEYAAGATADNVLVKVVGGTATNLATESVDLDDTIYYWWILSISGSTLKDFREDMATPKLTATDTDLTEGKWGYEIIANSYVLYTIFESVYLLPPQSDLPQPIQIIEYDVKQVYDEYLKRNINTPDMPQDLVEVSESDATPDEWIALQSNPKGVNGLPLVDKLSVTWGAIDYKGEPTMLCAIYEGSPSYLDPNRIQKHIDYAKSKNHKVLKPPKNISEAKALHKEIIKDRKDMLITSNELAYQLLGLSKLEVDAVSDFYERELINLNRIKNVPEWELDRTLERWMKLAEKHKRHNAYKKLKKVRRR